MSEGMAGALMRLRLAAETSCVLPCTHAAVTWPTLGWLGRRLAGLTRCASSVTCVVAAGCVGGVMFCCDSWKLLWGTWLQDLSVPSAAWAFVLSINVRMQNASFQEAHLVFWWLVGKVRSSMSHSTQCKQCIHTQPWLHSIAELQHG